MCERNSAEGEGSDGSGAHEVVLAVDEKCSMAKVSGGGCNLLKMARNTYLGPSAFGPYSP